LNTTTDPSTAGPGALASAYAEVRARTVALIAALEPEDCNLQPEPDVSPAKWHLAHTTWFFETFVLVPFAEGYTPFDARFGYCFNSYYEACGARQPRPDRHHLSRPLLREVLAWREAVDDAMGRLLASPGPVAADIGQRTTLGLHHEEQHQELLVMDVLAAFAVQPLRPAWRTDVLPAARAEVDEGWEGFDGGIATIGRAVDAEGFGFDNETPRHEVVLRPYALGRRLVTNRAWRAFVDDGGYRDARLWLSDGWAWVQANDIVHPRYWVPDGEGAFGQFTVRGLAPLEPDAPVVHVSAYEAEAFATWAGARLPTEAELEVAMTAQGEPEPGDTFLETGAWTPRPARPGPGVRQLWGDVWSWTRSAYLPYPGFAPLPGALGEYNGKFMSGQWVLKGGSCATPRGHIRATYRNFFHPHQRWMFSGLRLAKDATP